MTGGNGPDTFFFDVHRTDVSAGIIDLPKDVGIGSVGEDYPQNTSSMWAQTFTALSDNPGTLTLYLQNTI
jgi:hypothetical protein